MAAVRGQAKVVDQIQEDGLAGPLRLVLLGARAGAGDPDALADLPRQMLAEPPDWQEVLLNAFHHRLFPLFTEGLERGGAEVLRQVPAPALEELRAGRKQNALRAIMITLEAQRLILMLRQAGAEASVLKGTPLSMLLYGDPSLRHTGDLDLLVTRQELRDGEDESTRGVSPDVPALERQITRLGELGYVVASPACRLTPLRMASYRRFWKDLTLESTRGGPVLELHWRLFNNRLHGANRLPETGVEALTIYGATLPAMPKVEQFVYAAAHGCSDEWVYLKGLLDIATFLRHFTAVELDQAVELAGRLELLAQVSSAVHMARAWMGSVTMHPRLLPASDGFHVVMRERVLRRLRTHRFRPERQQLGALDAVRLELRLVPGWRTLLEIAERFLWRPRIWSAYDLPDRWFWVYPLLGLVTLPRPAPDAEAG